MTNEAANILAIVIGIISIFGTFAALVKVFVLVPERIKRLHEDFLELKKEQEEIKKKHDSNNDGLIRVKTIVEGVQSSLENICKE